MKLVKLRPRMFLIMIRAQMKVVAHQVHLITGVGLWSCIKDALCLFLSSTVCNK